MTQANRINSLSCPTLPNVPLNLIEYFRDCPTGLWKKTSSSSTMTRSNPFLIASRATKQWLS